MIANGFRPHGILGYWALPAPYSSTSVSDLNAGPSYRAKLAYMLRQLDVEESERRATREAVKLTTTDHKQEGT